MAKTYRVNAFVRISNALAAFLLRMGLKLGNMTLLSVRESPIPKLFIHSDPGTMQPAQLEFCRAWPVQSEVTVRWRHYPQEDSPDETGQAIASWLQTIQ